MTQTAGRLGRRLGWADKSPALSVQASRHWTFSALKFVEVPGTFSRKAVAIQSSQARSSSIWARTARRLLPPAASR